MPDLADKRAFLADPATYGASCRHVSVVETHAALVFLTETRAFKMKKNVRIGRVDLRGLSDRERFCREELRLNGALAEGVVQAVLPLTVDTAGRLHLGGPGEVCDWVIRMRRLPAESMLDTRLAAGGVGPAEIAAVAGKLARFYAGARPPAADGAGYIAHLRAETRTNTRHLAQMARHLGGPLPSDTIRAAAARLEAVVPEVAGRVAAGLVVDGHGDLRPEHICLTEPPVIFDRLEFDPLLRTADPHDEAGFLDLECRLLGEDRFGPALAGALAGAGFPPPSAALAAAYGAFRMVLRARIALDHFRDARVATPEKFVRQARDRLALAARILAGAG